MINLSAPPRPVATTYLVFTIKSVLNRSLGVGEKILSSGEETIVKEELAGKSALLTEILHESL